MTESIGAEKTMLSMAVKKKIAVISVLYMIAATFMSGCASSYVENSQEKNVQGISN